MTNALIEAAARALARHWQKCAGEDGENDDDYPPSAWLLQAEVVLAAVTPLIEAAALANERKEIAEQTRRYAGHYKEGSDGRNTFIMLAEWIEARK